MTKPVTTFTTRRTVLTGAVAATAATAVASTATAQPASAPAPDVATFVTISSILTGVAAGKLAPGVDPIKIKLQYFDLAKVVPAYANVVKIFNDNKKEPGPVIAQKILNARDPDTVALAQSIMLAWYLGAWYKPADLIAAAADAANQPGPTGPLFPSKIVSSAAYTQGWVWRVAQAHPMGYSEQRFGYWGEQPESLTVYVGA